MKRKSVKAVGIDVNEECVSVAEIVVSEKEIRILRSGTAATPDGVIEEGVVVRPGLAAKAVRRALRSGGISARGKSVAASLQSPGYVGSVMPVACGDESVARNSIQGEIKRYAIFAGEKTISDHAEIDDSRDGAKGNEEAFVAATRESTAAALISTLRHVGIDPRAIDIPPLAAVRAAYPLASPDGEAGVVLFAAIEPRALHVLLLQNGRIAFVHTAPRALDLRSPETSDLPHLTGAIRSVLEYYGSELGSTGEVGSIILSAGYDPHETVVAALREAFARHRVESISPSTVGKPRGLIVGKKHTPPTPCALGLALLVSGKRIFHRDLNLVTRASVSLNIFKKRALTGVALLVSVILLSLLATAAIDAGRKSAESKSTAISASLEKLVLSPGARNQGDLIRGLQASLEREMSFLETNRERIAPIELLELFRQEIPVDVRMLFLEEDGQGRLVIEGESLSADSVYRFASNLKKSEVVRSAKVAKINEVGSDRDRMSSFSMHCRVSNPAEEGSDEE